MPSNLIHDRGRGPEIVGTRTTVYNLLPYFLDPTYTEFEIAQANGLTPEQVAAARSAAFANADTVLARHMEIEARIEEGNPPEVAAWAERAREDFKRFKDWFAKRSAEDEEWQSDLPAAEVESRRSAIADAFRQWKADQDVKSAKAS